MNDCDYKRICEAIWDELEPLGLGRGPYLESMPNSIRKLVAKYEAQREAIEEIKRTMAA